MLISLLQYAFNIEITSKIICTICKERPILRVCSPDCTVMMRQNGLREASLNSRYYCLQVLASTCSYLFLFTGIIVGIITAP
jgi:hypothetical protein